MVDRSSIRVGDLVEAPGRKDWLPGLNRCRVLSRSDDLCVLQPMRFGMPRTVPVQEATLVEAWSGPELTRCDRDMRAVVRAPYVGDDGVLVTHGLGEPHDRPPTSIRHDQCDSEYPFGLYPSDANRRQLDEWMRCDPELVSKSEEGVLWHWRGGQGQGAFFLVSSEPDLLISFCVRYWPFPNQESDAIELTSWHCVLLGTRWSKAKETVFFDELLPRHRYLVSREDLRSGAARFWGYHMSYARDRGHHSGILMTDGTQSYLVNDAAAFDWRRNHGIASEGSLPRWGERFFIERA